MTVGIVGLGLIGGSMAKAFSRAEGVRVLGLDTDSIVERTLEKLKGLSQGE